MVICAVSIAQPTVRNLEIVPYFGQERVEMAKQYVNAAGDTLTIDVLRFYISGLRFTFSDNSVYEEKSSYHLYDMEDSERWKFAIKNVPTGEIKKIEFSIGVDSLMSVSGAMGGDLDPVNGMYWAWNSGYINAKMEGTSSSCKTLHHAYEFHIGGFMPPFQTIRNVIIEPKKPLNSDIVLKADASAWFSGLELKNTNSIMIPGAQAVIMADKYSTMFSIIE